MDERYPSRCIRSLLNQDESTSRAALAATNWICEFLNGFQELREKGKQHIVHFLPLSLYLQYAAELISQLNNKYYLHELLCLLKRV